MRKFKYPAFVIAVTVIGFIVVGEITLRITCSVCSYSEKSGGIYQSPYASDEWHNWYGLRPPNITTTYNLPEFDFGLHTNSLGLRDYEHPVKKDTNEIRIVGLGDSFTEGQGAPIEATWLQVLQTMLNNDTAQFTYRCISGGIYGSDPFISYKLLHDKLLAYDPDMVIVALNGSDLLDVMARGGDKRFLSDGKVKFQDVPRLEWLFFKSHLARLLLIEVFGYNWFVMHPVEQAEREQKALEAINQKILDFNNLSTQHGFKLLLLTHPFSNELLQHEYHFKADLIRMQADIEDIAILDLMEYFHQHYQISDSLITLMYWPRDLHHTPAGYRMFAEGVFHALSGAGLLMPDRNNSANLPDKHINDNP